MATQGVVRQPFPGQLDRIEGYIGTAAWVMDRPYRELLPEAWAAARGTAGAAVDPAVADKRRRLEEALKGGNGPATTESFPKSTSRR